MTIHVLHTRPESMIGSITDVPGMVPGAISDVPHRLGPARGIRNGILLALPLWFLIGMAVYWVS